MPTLTPFRKQDYPELHVLNFGYEIEGSFDWEIAERDEDNEYANEHYRHDGSVSVNNDDGDDGEIASPKFRIDRRKQFRIFVKENMPIETNSSCGIHVHASYNNALAFQKCCDVEFYTLFRKAVWRFMHNGLFGNETVTQFEARFHGSQDTYCRDGFNPDHAINLGFRDFRTKVSNFSAGRYNCINFESYNKFGTIECRMFPSSANSDEVIAMVEFWLEFCNSYLENVSPYERANFESTTVEGQDIEIKEDVLLCV